MMTTGARLTPDYSSYKTFGDGGTEIKLPDKYSLDTLEVYDQGSEGSCVSCAATEMMYLHDIQRDVKPSHDFPYLFHLRRDKTVNGMNPAEAFDLLKGNGRIKAYARMRSASALRQSIITHGAAMAVFKVGNEGLRFWEGGDNLGYHAVALTGWNKDGILIKNSWGAEWGNYGFSLLPWKDFSRIIELWTILS